MKTARMHQIIARNADDMAKLPAPYDTPNTATGTVERCLTGVKHLPEGASLTRRNIARRFGWSLGRNRVIYVTDEKTGEVTAL